MERRYIDSAAQMVPVSAYGSVALEECRRSADFMTGPQWLVLCVVHQEGPCPSSGDFIRLMMMMEHKTLCLTTEENDKLSR
jgi:hypothetical protein